MHDRRVTYSSSTYQSYSSWTSWSYVMSRYGLGPPTGTSLTRMYSVHTVTGTYHFMNLNQKYSGSESAWQASTTGMPVPRCRGGYRDILQNIIMTHCTQYILVLEKLEKYVLRVAGLGGTYLGPGKTWNYAMMYQVHRHSHVTASVTSSVITDDHDDVGFKLYYDIVTVLSSW